MSESSKSQLPRELLDFLPCETPEAWIEVAVNQQEVLLIDHANCEINASLMA